MKLEEKVKNFPCDPGVYLMKDNTGQVLYVGKAKDLKARVISYFQASRETPPRIALLIRKVSNVEVVITDNEAEALILECNLIKKYKPRFNVQLRDDKTYPYVRVDICQAFPRMEYVRRIKKDGARYFGPYVSAFHIKDFLRWAQKTFKLRDCADAEFRNRSRPCILYQMGQCAGPCVSLIDEKSYNDRIRQVLQILEGKTTAVLAELKKHMLNASEKEDFETAAELRDRVFQIEILSQTQKITDPESDVNRDLIHFARNSGNQVVAVVMSVRNGKVVGVFQYPFEEIDSSLTNDEFLFEFMAQYYLKRYEEAPTLLPSEVLFPKENELGLQYNLKILSSALGKKVEFRAPKRGEAKDTVGMVHKTANQHLMELSAKVSNRVEDLLNVHDYLKLQKFPHRIECYDISHFQGEGTVGSRVVFIDGKPEKTLYRHYHVRSVSGPDDFSSIREILDRRFNHDETLPDLVVIDGGKGQLAQVEAVFKELSIIGVDLVALAKARTESDFKEQIIESSMERVFKPNQKNPILLKPTTGAYRILTQVRNESHRFAIEFHRRVRHKQVMG